MWACSINDCSDISFFSKFILFKQYPLDPIKILFSPFIYIGLLYEKLKIFE